MRSQRAKEQSEKTVAYMEKMDKLFNKEDKLVAVTICFQYAMYILAATYPGQFPLRIFNKMIKPMKEVLNRVSA